MDRKIAIPINEDEMLESHFGHTRLFMLYRIENNTITSREKLSPPPHAPGVLPKWLNQNGVTEILASTMGERAKKILDYFNIKVNLGAPSIAADVLMEKFLAGKLAFNDELCDHHHHEHNHEHHHKHKHY